MPEDTFIFEAMLMMMMRRRRRGMMMMMCKQSWFEASAAQLPAFNYSNNRLSSNEKTS